MYPTKEDLWEYATCKNKGYEVDFDICKIQKAVKEIYKLAQGRRIPVSVETNTVFLQLQDQPPRLRMRMMVYYLYGEDPIRFGKLPVSERLITEKPVTFPYLLVEAMEKQLTLKEGHPYVELDELLRASKND